MCKITDYEFDEAVHHISLHAPRASGIIDTYVEQLKLERTQLLREIKRLANGIETLRLAGIEAVGMVDLGESAHQAYQSINRCANQIITEV